MDKRGASPVVITTAIVFLLIILGGLVVFFAFDDNFLQDIGITIDQPDTDFRIVTESIVYDNEVLNLSVERVSGSDEISGIQIVLENDEEQYVIEENLSLIVGEQKFFSIPTTDQISNVRRVSIIPLYIGVAYDPAPDFSHDVNIDQEIGIPSSSPSSSSGGGGGGGGGGSSTTTTSSPPAPVFSLTILSPSNGSTYSFNDSLNLTFTIEDSEGVLDSCWYSLDSNTDVFMPNCTAGTTSTFFSTSDGNHTIIVSINDSGGNILNQTTGFDVNITVIDSIVCGDGIIDTNETCDSNSQACTIGGYVGSQDCNSQCDGFDSCVATESCGDGIVNGNEVCDGSQLNGQSCTTQGFDSGTLNCLSDCSGYDTTQCVNNPVCGNNIIESGEQCDDGNANNGDGCDSSCQIEIPITQNPLFFEAEDGVLTGSNIVANGLVDFDVGGQGSYQFNITEAGNYYIATNVDAAHNGINSFYAYIDTPPSQTEMTWDIIDLTSGIEIRNVSWRGLNGDFDNPEFDPKLFNLGVGGHTLYIQGREPGTQIDNLTIVKFEGSLNCQLTSASWSANNVVNNTQVDLNLVGNNCNSEAVEFTIYEDDGVLDEFVTTISSTYPSTFWNALWQEDGIGDPEFYFVANPISNSSNVVTSGNLIVTPPAPTQVCGNNIIESGEVCDGSDLNSQTCTTQGFDSGTLGCLSDCSGYDTSQCVSNNPQCSDGVDNDGDTLVDLADPGCSNSNDNDELNLPTSPTPTFWSDSFSVDEGLNGEGTCYCDSTFDHNTGSLVINTPVGPKTILEVCNDMPAAPPDTGNRIYYNDIQCGNGPPNDAGDEQICPAIPEDTSAWTGPYCNWIGPTFDLSFYDSGNCTQSNILCVDDTPGSTQEYSTIQAAANAAGAGDTVMVYPGNYPERLTLTNGGSSGNLITFRSQINHQAHMEGFTISTDYIRIEGFNISNTGGNDGILIQGDNNEIVNNFIHNFQETGIAAPSGQSGGVYPHDNNLISGNHIFRTKYGMVVRGNNWLIEDNEVERLYCPTCNVNNDADYTLFFGNNHIFKNNFYHGTVEGDIGTAHVDGFQSWGFNSEYAHYIQFIGNIITDAHQCVLFESGPAPGSISDLNFTNNVCNGVTSYGIAAKDDNYNLIIAHNIFANIGSYGIGIRDGSTATIKNNIFYNIPTFAPPYQDGTYHGTCCGTIDAGNNVIWNTGTQGGLDTIEIESDPQFIGSLGTQRGGSGTPFLQDTSWLGADGEPFTNDDHFQLQSGSPGVDAGVNLNVLEDIFETSRPQGNGFDIGPHELISGTPASCQLTSASWSEANVTNNTQVTLSVVGSNCAGEQIAFNIWEDDNVILAHDPFLDDEVTTIVSTFSSTTWMAEWQEDGIGSPEFYFRAWPLSDTNNIVQSDNMDVTLPPPPPVCGDNVVEGSEVCDGSDLAGNDCTTVAGGFTGGTLSCNSQCTGFDTTQCTAPLPQCSDGVDNDGDTLVDLADPGCSDSNDNDETNVVINGDIYYVSTSGNNADGSSWASAWNGFDQINWNSIDPGDIVYVAGGTYNSDLDVGASGTQGNPIIIRKATINEHGSNTGWQASFDNPAVIDGSANIKVENQNYVLVDGVHGSTSNNGLNEVTPYGFKVDSDNTAGVHIEGSNHITVQYVHVAGTNNDNLYGQVGFNSPNEGGTSSSNILISHNWFNDMENDAMKIGGLSDSIIEFNSIGPNKFSPNGQCQSNGCHGDGAEIRSTSNITYRYNIVNYGHDILLFGINGASSGRWDVYGNRFIESGGFVIRGHSDFDNGGMSAGPIYVYNNVFLDPGFSAFAIKPGMTGDIQNNIFYTPNSGGTGGVGALTFSNNYEDDTAGGNPFVDLANYDLHLEPNSSLINAGSNVGAQYSIDPDGNIRGGDGSWDIGAYEFGSNTCDTNADCDNNLFCDGAETCVNNVCVAGTPPTTNDGISCTVDSCDEVTDTIVHTPSNALCDDGNVCTTGTCSATLDCQYSNNANSCSDGNSCTLGDICSAGACVPGSTQTQCSDNDGCCPGGCDFNSDNDCSPPVDQNIVFHLPLDGNFNDATGIYNASCTNCPTSTTGRVNGAYDFDGSNDVLSLPILNPPHQGSIAMWINLDANSGTQRPLGSDDDFEIRLAGPVVNNDLFAAGTGYTSASTSLATGTWNYIILTWNLADSEHKIYINGNLDAVGSNADDDPGNSLTLSIGTRTGNSDYVDGKIDDVRMYDIVLTDQEVSDLYNSF